MRCRADHPRESGFAKCYPKCYQWSTITDRQRSNPPCEYFSLSSIRRVLKTYSHGSAGIIIRVSGVRVPPPLLVQEDALRRTRSSKSATRKGLGVFFCARSSLSRWQRLAADRSVSRAVCCARSCALCGAPAAWSLVPVARRISGGSTSIGRIRRWASDSWPGNK